MVVFRSNLIVFLLYIIVRNEIILIKIYFYSHIRIKPLWSSITSLNFKRYSFASFACSQLLANQTRNAFR